MIIYLIDGNGFCYRAFHAIRDLRNSKGEPTNVVFGFQSMLKKLLEDFTPDGIAVFFDTKGPTFRHKKYEEYKSHRKPMPDDLVVQMPVVKRLVDGFRIPRFELSGYEADDLIGTVAKSIVKEGHQAVIVTGDKDMLQLVNHKVKVLNPQKDYFVYDSEAVKKRYGVSPEQVVDVLALMGDASDYIPGVPGIGEKTAVQLVQKYGGLDNILKNVDKIPQEARRKALTENRKDAILSRELAEIDTAVPFEYKVEDLKVRPADNDKLRELYTELEFRSLLKDLGPDPSAPKHKKDFRLITDEKEWKELRAALEKAGEFAFDFETTSLDALTAEPVGMSFCCKPHSAAFVLFSTHESGKSKIKPDSFLKANRDLFENPRIRKIGQNLKYELTILKRRGIRLRGLFFDTMIGSYVLNASKRNHNMGGIALEHLNETLIPIESLIGKGKNAKTMDQADLEALTAYGCQDSDVAFRLSKILSEKVEQAGLGDLLNKMELPLVEVICDMEMAGIAIDKALLRSLSEEMEEEIRKLTKKIHKAAKEEFNINSPKQLGEVLFVKLGLPVQRKTKTGFSTDSDVLTQLADAHELPQLILEFRELSKLKSTYVDTMPDCCSKLDGRVHSSFNQTVTETGRLSSNEPNLQNIPIRTEEGRKIRKAFVAEKGKRLLSADYSQIDLRVLAHLSGDKILLKAFKERQDVHAYTAGLIFGVDPKDVTPKMRETAKTVNFGVIYGMGAFGLSRSLKITQEAAKDFIKSYFERYPGVKEFLDGTIESARKKGYVETLWKRRRYIPDILTSDARIRQYAERTAINAPVQGTSSDLIKIAMVNVHRDMEKLDEPGRLVLQVHDELVFEVPEKGLNELARLVKKDMEGAAELDVPIEVTLKAGKNWLEMEKL